MEQSACRESDGTFSHGSNDSTTLKEIREWEYCKCRFGTRTGDVNRRSCIRASKGGLVSLTRSLALELADYGIRVICIVPGAVDTRMLREGLSRIPFESQTPEERLENLIARTPLKRVGTPEEMAKAIAFLSSPDESSFITGQTLVIDGGALARLSTE